MNITYMVELNREELERIGNLFCETFHSSRFNTGKSKRIRAQMFTNEEWNIALKLLRMCSRWGLSVGVPNEKKFGCYEWEVLKKLEKYCVMI